MRVIARRTLREFVTACAGREDQPALKAALDAWYDEVRNAKWTNAGDLKRSYRTASIVTAERVVFYIKGNDYRLVAAIDFEKGIACGSSGSELIGTTIASMSARWTMANEVRPIRTEDDYQAALKEMKRLWGWKTGTPEGDRLDVLATPVDAYESQHVPIDPPDPIEAIKFRMEQQGLSLFDLEAMLGPRAGVAENLNRKRSLSIAMIRRLHEGLGIRRKCLSARRRRRTTRDSGVRLSRALFEQLPPDQHAPDLARAGADLVELGVAQQAPERVIVGVAGAAENLDRVEGDLSRALG
jgi:HTH-type transcriptional regulator/antitoxin HigA